MPALRRMVSPTTLGSAVAGWKCAACGNEPPEVAGVPVLAPDVADGFRPGSFDLLADAEDKSFWFRQRNALIVETLARSRREPRRTSRSAAATATCWLRCARHFPALAVVGAELHPEGLVHARRRLPEVPLLQLDARRLPFADEYDVIGAFDVLEHIDDDVRRCASIHAALHPAGCCW